LLRFFSCPGFWLTNVNGPFKTSHFFSFKPADYVLARPGPKRRRA
jgi:hypothetical protein